MSGIPWDTFIEQVRDIIDAVIKTHAGKPAREAAGNASKLFFWQDGMLGPLEKIAGGDVSADTLETLREAFDGSTDEAAEMIEALRVARSRLAGTPKTFEIAELIDQIVYSPLGKLTIRYQVQGILDNRAQPAIVDRAKQACEMIAVFNGNVRKLQQLVSE